MAYNSRVVYPSISYGTTTYAFSFPFTDSTYVKVYINGSALPHDFGGGNVTYTVGSSSIVLSNNTAHINGYALEVRRDTKITADVDFVNGTTLTESDLDGAVAQSLQLSVESKDTSKGALTIGSTHAFLDASNIEGISGRAKISNLANGTSTYDAVNKSQLDTGGTQAVANTAALVTLNATDKRANSAVKFDGTNITLPSTTKIENVTAGSNTTSVVNKAYVDDKVVPIPTADQAKLDHITVGQAVNLDTIESNTNTNNAKVSNATHSGDVTGSTTLTIAADAVTAAKLADDAVVTANIVDNNVTTAKILNNNVTRDKLAFDCIDSTRIADDAVTSDHLAEDSVNGVAIADNSIANSSMANNAIDTAELAAGAVETAKIADLNVTRAKIADGAINGDKIAVDAIAGTKIADAGVTLGKINIASVTNANHAAMAASTIKGNNAGTGGPPIDLSVAQTNTLLGLDLKLMPKAFGSFTTVASPVVSGESFNISGVAKVSTGRYTVSFTSAMSDVDYTVTLSYMDASETIFLCMLSSKVVGSFNISLKDSGGSLSDASETVDIVVHEYV